jgi:transitional endoplasmic reticulum ATPase
MQVSVKPLKGKDAGEGIAVVSQDVLDTISIEAGDFVSVESDQGSMVVRAWANYNQSGDAIHIDGQTRSQLGVHIDSTVSVSKADITRANSATVALPEQIEVKGNFTVQAGLANRVVEEGDTITLSLLGAGDGSQSIPVLFTETEPQGKVLLTDATNINVSQYSYEEAHNNEPEQDIVTYEDIGGLDKELQQVREMVELPMNHPELFDRLGVDAPKGVLLEGPPGTGKTLIAEAVANEVDAEFFTISGPEIMSKYFGESEQQLREVFNEAESAESAIIFIDEIDSIAPERGEATGDVERRVVAQLLALMDGLDADREVIVIGATNRVDAMDSALRRGGRFDREIEVGVPSKDGRREILDVHTRNMPVEESVDLDHYSEKTHGFVGADIETFVKEAAMIALRRVRPDLNLEEGTIPLSVLEDIHVTESDLKEAIKEVEPSALREVFVEVPDVTWENVGGLEETQERLRESVQWPLNFPDVFEDMDMAAPSGILLYGPPGTGKTLMAKAVANESETNFISVKGPELLNKYVGESEAGVRDVFEKARSNAPTVVFFDEIDAIATPRGSDDGGNNVNERVVSQLLTELDGLESLEDVTVIATTNRPDLIDAALMRPGRLDRHIHVPVPETQGRAKVIEVHTEDKPLAKDVNTDWLARETDGYVGADIEALLREAALIATRDLISGADHQDELDTTTAEITEQHLEQALDEVGPSVTPEVREQYEEIEENFQQSSVEEESEDDRRGGAFR